MRREASTEQRAAKQNANWGQGVKGGMMQNESTADKASKEGKRDKVCTDGEHAGD